MFNLKVQLDLIVIASPGPRVTDGIASSVLHDIGNTDVFGSLHDHMFDCSIGDNHIFNLIKRVSKKYARIRMFHLGKEFKAHHIEKTKVRKTLSKLILFKHQ